MTSSNSATNYKSFFVVKGYSDDILGDISGWRGIVVGSFVYNNTRYYDMEISADTISRIGKLRQKEFFKKGIVFSKIRVPEQYLSGLPASNQKTKTQSLSIQRLQYEWYEQVGYNYDDPTRLQSGSFDSFVQSPERRELLKTLALLGVGTILFAGLSRSCSEDDDDYYYDNSHWYHSGGG
jgi:hypothetical protein